MKIAYFICLELGVESGVLKKIHRQVDAWAALGHDVRLFYISAEPPILETRINERYWCRESVPDGYLSKYYFRMTSIYSVEKSIEEFKPDILYARQVLWFLGVGRLFKKHITIVECNTNDIVDIKDKSLPFRLPLFALRSFFFRHAKAVVSVTDEIRGSFGRDKKFKAITNSFPIPKNLIKKGQRKNKVFFMSSPNQPWQGVDKIIELAIHLPEYDWVIAGWDRRAFATVPDNVLITGYITGREIKEHLKESGYAVGPLALHRKNMSSTSAIKIGEYLAFNLPVILAYRETEVEGEFFCLLPNEEKNITPDSVKKIREFLAYWANKEITADSIRSMIDSEVVEKRRLAFFEEVLCAHCG